MRTWAQRDLRTAGPAAELRFSRGSRAAFRVHSSPQRAARRLPGGADPSRTFRTPREQADPNPDARAGVGLGPLLTAAEPAAVAGLVEGAAGAAHSGQKGGLVNQRSQPPIRTRRGGRPGAAIARKSPRRRDCSSNSARSDPQVLSARAKRSAGLAVRTPGEARLRRRGGRGRRTREGRARKQERTGTGSQVSRRWGVQSRRRGKRPQKQGYEQYPREGEGLGGPI